MIIDSEVEIKIVNKSIREHYLDLGYDVSKYRVVVSVDHLLKNSHVLINVKCDICGSEKQLKYLRYNKNISKHNIYTCNNSCAQVKNRMTSVEKYGVDHYSKTIEYKKKMSKDGIIINDKYCICGIKISKKSKMCIPCNNRKENDYFKIKAKRENTMLRAYGVTNSMYLTEFKDKVKKTNNIKYGVENTFQYEEFKDKIKKTNNTKYGVDYPSQSVEIRNKMLETLMINYGVDHPLRSIEILNRMIENNIIKYGYKSPMCLPEVVERMLISRGNKRKYDMSIFNEYKKVVNSLTSKNKKVLLEKWNGLDYYDDEYIRNNFLLDPNHINYPTIDHKESIFGCFMNNIDPIISSGLDNLCVTKRTLNSTKNSKNEEEFKSFLRSLR